VIVFGFYQMFFAGDESAAYSQAQAKVKWAWMALLILGLSRIGIQFIFEVFTAVSNIGG
jgi:hypothetical protein